MTQQQLTDTHLQYIELIDEARRQAMYETEKERLDDLGRIVMETYQGMRELRREWDDA
jgi:hypothetical protein